MCAASIPVLDWIMVVGSYMSFFLAGYILGIHKSRGR